MRDVNADAASAGGLLFCAMPRYGAHVSNVSSAAAAARTPRPAGVGLYFSFVRTDYLVPLNIAIVFENVPTQV